MSGTKFKAWGDTKFYDYISVHCPWQREDHYNLIRLLLMKYYIDYPDREARIPSILCGSTNDSTDCDGHPPGTHTYGKAIDLHYFTLGKSNHTQNGTDIVRIFTNGKPNELFDVERNCKLICDLRRTCNATISTNTYLKKVIEQYYGEFLPWLTGDTNAAYAHDKHMHVQLGGINWDESIYGG